MVVRHDLSDTGRARRFDGKPARMYGFRLTNGIFYAGKFMKEAQPDGNLNYWALWASHKF